MVSKCLLLLNPLHPLTHLLSPTPTSAPAILNHLINLASALADDTFTLARLGIVSRRKGRVADRWAKYVPAARQNKKEKDELMR
jgi:hypothetical protein